MRILHICFLSVSVLCAVWACACMGKISAAPDGGQDGQVDGADGAGDQDGVGPDGDQSPDGESDGDGNIDDEDPIEPVCPNGECEAGEDAATCSDCAQCPNGVAEAGEECDGAEPLGVDCRSLGFDSGELACAEDCSWNTGECVVARGQCNDGVDNDQDGLTDWQMDLGCYSASDDSEGSPETFTRQDGWTVFEASPESRLVYVSSSQGDDSHDGSSAQLAVRSLARGIELVRDGQPDFLLLRRGDSFRDEAFGRFKSGLDGQRRLVVASYGESTARPRLEVSGNALNHDGHSRSHLAFVGLEIYSYTMDPDHPDYSGQNVRAGFRMVGNGDDYLIEDCLFRFCEVTVQSFGDDSYRNVELRRNIITSNYAHGTCPSNSENRPSGIYASHVDGLTIEQNMWDHNGWNEDVATACATMYNHNMYLSGGHDLVVRGNLILRASSMGIKMRSDSTGDYEGITIEDNLFVEGEIGIGIGGNTSEALRFVDVTIQDNVLSHIGRTRPTDRDFAWYLGVQDNQTAAIRGNLFIHQPWHDNSFGISLGGDTAQDITVEDNWFYGIRRRHLQVQSQAAWQGIAIQHNYFLDTDLEAQLVDHSGSFAAVDYSGNHYWSSAQTAEWFEVDDALQSLAQWQSSSGESDSDSSIPPPPFPERTLETYCAEVLNLQADLDSFVQQALQQSRHGWNSQLSAPAINDYIRAGFGLSRAAD